MIRQLLTESLLLSGLGAGLGLALAYGGVRLAVHLDPEHAIPRANEISLDVRILAFAVLITCLTALLFGLFPALGASKPDMNESLKEGGRRTGDHRGARRIQGALVVGQVALSLVLLIGAGLMIRNAWRQLHTNAGFNTDHLAQKNVLLRGSDYVERIGDGLTARVKPKAALTIERIEERLRALPGVDAVSIAGSGILCDCSKRPIAAEGPLRTDRQLRACYEPVGRGYFQTLQIPVRKGRVFTEGDTSHSPPVAIISESVAKRYFPGQDPLGKMITIGNLDIKDVDRRQVVGVVGDVLRRIDWPIYMTVYYPESQQHVQFPWQSPEYQLNVTFAIRSAIDPATLGQITDRAVLEVADDMLVGGVWTAEFTRWNYSKRQRFFSGLLTAFAGTALALAVVGVFGVMSYEVSRRTHEIGIRMALGAHPRAVLGLILRTGVYMAAIGLVIGLAGTFGLIRFLRSRSLLYTLEINYIRVTDPTTLAAVSLVLAVVVLLASYIPARRATQVDPVVALRHE